MSVPLRDRLYWGAYRNLIAGVTTVAHHDPYVRSVFDRHYPVSVLRFEWAHSLGFGTYVAARARLARIRRRPFVIHAAEGTDEIAALEIDRLHEMGVLRSNTVLVHALTLEPRHIDMIAEGGCSVVWCPASNEYLYKAYPPVAELRRRGVPVALGTDSTLSGSATLLDEIRIAHESGEATAEELSGMVTTEPARIFGLRDGRGTLRDGGRADVAIFRDESILPEGPPALVLVGGEVRLAEENIALQLDLGTSTGEIAGRPTWLYGSPHDLKDRISSLLCKETLERVPLWTMLQQRELREPVVL
jgi:hypothetical protein